MAGRTDSELVPGGTAARLDRSYEHVVGREDELEVVHARLREPGGPRLVVVRGERGVGRSVFVRALGKRLRAEGVAVVSLACAVGDAEHPLLLALRLVRELPAPGAVGAGRGAVRGRGGVRFEADALAAVETGDPAAMGLVLAAAAAPGQVGGTGRTVVVIEDAQHADADSLRLLGGDDGGLLPAEVRLLVTVAEHGAACERRADGAEGRGGVWAPAAGSHPTPPAPYAWRRGRYPHPEATGAAPPRGGGPRSSTPRGAGPVAVAGVGVGDVADGPGGQPPVEWLVDVLSSYSLVLRRLREPEVAEMVGGRLQATPQPDLVRRVHRLGRGVPAAVDALLTGWVGEGAIRVADGHAFLSVRVPVPLLPYDHPLVADLRALGEPYGTVAGALSILWPLGRSAPARTAAVTGLSAEEVGTAIRVLRRAGIVEELKAPAHPAQNADHSDVPRAGDRGTRGWMFRLPLVEHTVREGLGPLERARLSAAAVSELWGERGPGAGAGPGVGVGISRGTGARPGPGPGVSSGVAEDAGPGAGLGVGLGGGASTGAGVGVGVGPGSGAAEGPGPVPGAGLGLPAQVDAVAYQADRIADAGVLVDRARAVEELVRAADQLLPDAEGPGTLRYLRAALELIEDPGEREHVLLRYAKVAYVVGDYPGARATGEEILRDPADSLTDDLRQDVALLLVAATAASEDWAQVSRMASAHWWRDLPLPPIAALTGEVLALSGMERWHEALDVLSRTEPMWRTGTREQWNPEWFRVCAEWVLGRPERFGQLLSTPYGADMTPDSRHALTMAAADQLLGVRDLRAVTRLLAFRGLGTELLPPYTRFLWRHLRGRWDEALADARWMLANRQAYNPAPSHHLLPARTAAMLLARGRVTSARRLVDNARNLRAGPLEVFLDHAEAEVLRALGDTVGAERILRRGLAVAGERGHAYGTDELWALLAELRAEAGRISEAADALAELEALMERTGGERTRLLWLVASARVEAAGGPGGAGLGQERLAAAVELVRSREQPFETAVVLMFAARAGAGPEGLLYEAYDLFGEVGAALCRFHARTAMREAGLPVPDRRQVTAENEQLLATLITEGLSNRRIASVLRVSEDAVANRLTRLLSRTGLRSRTEVATAVLTGNGPTWPAR